MSAICTGTQLKLNKMGFELLTWQCKFCKKLHIYNNKKYKYCNCMENKKEVPIKIDQRMYIHPKEMSYISYVLNSKDEFTENQRKWCIQRIAVRLSILEPLVRECINKDLDLEIIDKDLKIEYLDLIFFYNKFNDEF